MASSLWASGFFCETILLVGKKKSKTKTLCIISAFGPGPQGTTKQKTYDQMFNKIVHMALLTKKSKQWVFVYRGIYWIVGATLFQGRKRGKPVAKKWPDNEQAIRYEQRRLAHKRLKTLLTNIRTYSATRFRSVEQGMVPATQRYISQFQSRSKTRQLRTRKPWLKSKKCTQHSIGPSLLLPCMPIAPTMQKGQRFKKDLPKDWEGMGRTKQIQVWCVPFKAIDNHWYCPVFLTMPDITVLCFFKQNKWMLFPEPCSAHRWTQLKYTGSVKVEMLLCTLPFRCS